MIYLASPYSHADEAVREARFRAVCRHAAHMMRAGRFVFSPIAHTHPIAAFGLPGDWAYWEQYDRAMLARCSELIVLMLDGWRESKGVQAEIGIAASLGKPVSYATPEDAA